MSIRVSYAQNREDIILEAFFSDISKGFYVDIGANHPENDSVTKYFYDKGWTGINIEPNKTLFDLLVAERPKDTNLNLGVSNKKGVLKFREYSNHGLSTFSQSIQEGYENSHDKGTESYKTYDIPVLTLKQIFSDLDTKHIHFLKIDVEGFEYEVLSGNDWTKFRPEIICIESNHMVRDWRPILAKNNYDVVFHDGLNDYYLSKESKIREKNFSYPEQIVLGPPILHISSLKEISKAREELQQANERYAQEKSEVSRLQQHVEFLHEELLQQKSIRKQIKLLLKSVDAKIYNRIDHIGRDSKYTESLPITSDKRHLLNNVREQDFVHFYDSMNHKKIRRKVALNSYNASRNFVKTSLKATKAATKKIKGIAK